MQQLRVAFAVAFARPWSYGVAALGAAAMFALLSWSGQVLTHYPTGWVFQASPLALAGLGALAMLFGLLMPLQMAALAKARSASAAASGLTASLVGLLSVTCCTPLLIPALLSFVGFSGTAILRFNGTMREYATPLMLFSLLLFVLSIGLVARTLGAACALPSRQPASNDAAMMRPSTLGNHR